MGAEEDCNAVIEAWHHQGAMMARSPMTANEQSRILHTSAGILSPFLSTLGKEDISTLQNWGHFYFALTVFSIDNIFD
jgi:hypothetical protein